MAEESDVAVVVVSEETGTISLAIDGKLHRGLIGGESGRVAEEPDRPSLMTETNRSSPGKSTALCERRG